LELSGLIPPSNPNPSIKDHIISCIVSDAGCYLVKGGRTWKGEKGR